MTGPETRELDDGGPQEVPEGKMGEKTHLEGHNSSLCFAENINWPVMAGHEQNSNT